MMLTNLYGILIILIRMFSPILSKEADYYSQPKLSERLFGAGIFSNRTTEALLNILSGSSPSKRRNTDDNEVLDNEHDNGITVIETGNESDDNVFVENLDVLLPEKLQLIQPDENYGEGSRCIAGQTEGKCYSKRSCYKKNGQIGGRCESNYYLYCCTFIHTCGDSSSETVTYFQSPSQLSTKSQGSLACDYDILVRKDVCAVRIEYLRVNLARKLGGVCDIDQIYILNSVDGPTTGQCGPLSGYVTTVAVKPHQDKPLKIALLVQNEGIYYWTLKTTQLPCNDVHNFKAPEICGINSKFSLPPSADNNLSPPTVYSQSEKLLEDKRNEQRNIWWSFPEPVFNMYHYRATKKYILQERKYLSGIPMMAENLQANRRIVGGSDANLNEFPWQVAIALGNMFFCGGALINEMFVLTAAHCIMTRDTRIENLIIYMGDHDLSVRNETNHVIRGVKRILFHSHFHSFLLENDIALLQLDKSVVFTSNVQPICLPDSNESYSTKKATVAGWGITSYPMGEPSSILQKINVEVISNFQCSRIIEEPVGAGMLCAAPAALQGTCFGDSGGPLTVESEHGQNILIGLVSYGLTGCALVPNFPDIYTRVSEYIKWIEVNAIQN